ncbi:MAG: hypothetical protein IJH84_23745, partial [Saccharopolyspora sp.]|uniref:toxin glutamine deamidase domain-containing protein n=1 Tax=Saccharopolyspora sp. TaxID=33915 RepID=UPI0025D91953
TDGDDRPAIEGNVELHVESTAACRLQELASNPSEREVVLLPSSQLMVHSKELVPYEAGDGSTKHKWVIHAEEIAPGDPRHLGQDQAKQLMVERQDLARRQAAEFAASNDFDSVLNPAGSPQDHAAHGEPSDGRATSGLHIPTETAVADPGRSADLDGVPAPRTDSATELPGEEPGPSKLERMLAPDDTPFSGHPADPFGPDDGFGATGPPLDVDGNPDWRQLERSTPPVTNLPAIHNDTAVPEHHAAYVDQRHPELRAVNPNFDHPNAYENGTRTNCTRCVVSYAQRLIGIDAQAEPVLPNELKAKGTLPWVQQQLGGAWESHGSYDDVISRMSGQPLGSHAVIGVQFATPDGVLGHVAMVTNTPEGVAFIDPQSGTLMQLPHPPLGLHLLPFGSLESELPDAGAGHSGDHTGGAAEKSAEPQESADAPLSDTDGVRESPADDLHRLPDGPWFGQHTNPFRPTIEEEEPASAVPPTGAAHYGRSAGEPGAEEPGTSAPAVPHEPAPANGPQGTSQASDVPAVPGHSESARLGGMNRSMSGTLEPETAAQDPAEQTGSESGGPASAGSAAPGTSTSSAVDARAGDAPSA